MITLRATPVPCYNRAIILPPVEFPRASAKPRRKDIVPSGSSSRVLHTIGEISILTYRSFIGLITPPYRMGSWMKQMEQIGVRSLLVASITATFTGMVLALQTAYSLPTLGVKFYVGTLVSKSVVRELGPVLTALIVGGRIGAGMTAEIGTMKVTEQIDALRSMAADPVKELVVPKLAATLVMLPVLTVIGNVLGILGGLLVAVSQLNVTAPFYLNQVFDSLLLSDVCSGIGKSFFFAYFIAIIGCYNGLHAQGGADGVGRATTNTVVYASILVLVSDFFLTKLFYTLF
jgi:phospholipid/cholesterol/gamma-HCH transport system permease protein